MDDMRNTIGPDVYTGFCLAHAPRVLGALDRNPLSPTFGCQDWRYWHDKVSDIPSGHDQEMIYFLALLYCTTFEGNLYYKDESILEYIKAGIRFWTGLLGRNGALDEFYPNEAQLGATAIVAWAMSETYQIIKPNLSTCEDETIRKALLRSGTWLCKHDEKTNLANHQSQAMMALYNIQEITGDQAVYQGFNRRKERVLRLYHNEGWFEEYDFFDPGYLTTNLSFLCRYWQHTRDQEILSLLTKCLDMLRYCFLPDGRFGGVVGSRNTKHCWPSTFEILADRDDSAKSLAAFYRQGLSVGSVFTPTAQDRYFAQQLYDYLWAYTNAPPALQGVKPLPFIEGPFHTYFEDAGILAAKNKNGQCLLVNVKKGGTYHYCHVTPSNRVLAREANSGIAAELKNGKKISNDYCGGGFGVAFRENGETLKLSVQGHFFYSNYPVPRPATFLAFRLFNLILGWIHFIGSNFRHMLARRLIMNRKKAEVTFRRTIDISANRIKITDRIKVDQALKGKIECVFFGGNFANIYVPYSKGFEIADLSRPQIVDSITSTRIESTREF